MIFSRTTPAVLAAFFIGFTLTGTAQACSTDGWDFTSGSVDVGSPFGTTPPDVDGISRFEELCALRADGAGYVETDTPSHNRVRIRFYVFADLVSTRGVGTPANILNAYDGNGGTGNLLLNIAFNDGNLIFDATPNGGTQGSLAAPPGWNQVEVDFNTGSGQFAVWLNTDATGDLPDLDLDAGSAATMESVRVGLPDGLGTHAGAAYVDSFQMHNETAIGPVPNCDANADTNFNVFDLLAAIDEINEFSLATGTPDCDFSGGALNVFDLLAMIDVINAQ